MKIYGYSCASKNNSERYLYGVKERDGQYSIFLYNKERPFYDILLDKQYVIFDNFQDAANTLQNILLNELNVEQVSFDDPKIGDFNYGCE